MKIFASVNRLLAVAEHSDQPKIFALTKRLSGILAPLPEAEMLLAQMR
jgi:hypothetical protein